MKREKRNLDSRALVGEACRLPPGGLERFRSVRADQDEYSFRFFMRRYARELVITLLTFSLITTLVIAPAVDYSPRLSISRVRPLAGTPGWDASNDSYQSSTSAHLVNDTDLSYRSGWWNDTRRLGVNPAICEGFETSDGFLVSVVESSVTFARELILPIQDYGSLNTSLQVEVVSGSANVSLGIGLGFPHDNDAESEIEIDSGQTESLVANLSLDHIRTTHPDDWFLSITFQIVISAEQQAAVVLRRLDIEAHSPEKLGPVSVDLQTTGGYSLFTDPQLLPWYPCLLLNITRLNDGKQGTVRAQVVNETFYLPFDNYTVEASWSRSQGWWGAIDPEKVDFTIRENLTALLTIRLPTIRLDIEHSTDVVTGHISIRLSGDYEYVYIQSLRGVAPLSLYLPASVYSIIVDVSHETAWGYPGWGQCSYESDGSSDLLLTIDYPGIVVFGAVLTGIDVAVAMLLAALVIALLLRFRQALFAKKTRPIPSDPGLIPLIMITVGAFLPWFTYDYTIGQTEYSGVVLPQFSIITQRTRLGLAAPYMIGDYWWILLVPLFFALFWLPVLGILNQIGTEVQPLDWRRVMCITFPAAMALACWLVAVWYGSVPDVGFWLVGLSPVAFFVQVVFQRILAATRNSA